MRALIRSSGSFYRPSGRFALHFARSKLRYDPAYRMILAHGLLSGPARVLDLGCGQGLLAAWLLAARACYTQGNGGWPRAWPAPPALEAYRGIDINMREVARARRAFAAAAGFAVSIEHGDIGSAAYAPADAVVLLDVLHYLNRATQEQVLRGVRTALAPRGLLLLRIGDAQGGLGHRVGNAIDHTVALLRRGRWVGLACRALSDWEQLLERCGFSPRAVPLPGNRSFANVLFRAQLA
jgi:SAM-dependent methyltransferase